MFRLGFFRFVLFKFFRFVSSGVIITACYTTQRHAHACRVLLERTLKSWGIWHTFNAAAASDAAAAAESATAAAVAAKASTKQVISLFSPSKGKLAAKFGSRLSTTPRKSPHEASQAPSDAIPGLFSMNEVTVVW
jgi:hypothetical protein